MEGPKRHPGKGPTDTHKGPNSYPGKDPTDDSEQDIYERVQQTHVKRLDIYASMGPVEPHDTSGMYVPRAASTSRGSVMTPNGVFLYLIPACMCLSYIEQIVSVE